MEIYITETGKVVTEQEFRSMYLNVSFPTQLTEDLINQFGGEVVLEGPQATVVPPYQYSQRSGIEKINGKWFTKYTAGPIFTDRPATDTEPAQTAAEQEAAYKAAKDAEQAKAVRTERDKKLTETDWMVIKAIETGIPVAATVTAERQALRDISKQIGFPWDTVWPTKP